MKKQVVIYQLVLDQSGSMDSVAADTISGFNEQVQRIKEMNEFYSSQDIRVNLCLFNHNIKHFLFNCPPGEINELSHRSYRPDGMTALYDAVGDSIRKVKKLIKTLSEEAQVKVFFVIITDGHENSSRNYNFEKISSQIAKLERKKTWEFSYLGSTLDAVEIAESMNIQKGNAMYFREEEIAHKFETVSCKMEKLMDSLIEDETLEEQ
jgi:hypothetical protein